MMTAEERQALLKIARASIVRAFEERGTPLEPASRGQRGAAPEHIAGQLARKGGAFVTLRTEGELRGCIGYIESPLPIWRVVEEVAAKAAFEDPRFSPLDPAEFAGMSVEISVLTSPEQMKSPEEMVIGEHGLIIEHMGRRGLLLPQVATEYGWDRDQFLEHVCRKAGLPANAWREPGAVVYLFRADIIKEAHHA